jgi:hypothetical protein
MRMEFSDGMKFDTSGPLRIEQRSDGLYVVGKGMLCAVNTREEGEKMIGRIMKPAAVPSRAENEEFIADVFTRAHCSLEDINETIALVTGRVINPDANPDELVPTLSDEEMLKLRAHVTTWRIA